MDLQQLAGTPEADSPTSVEVPHVATAWSPLETDELGKVKIQVHAKGMQHFTDEEERRHDVLRLPLTHNVCVDMTQFSCRAAALVKIPDAKSLSASIIGAAVQQTQASRHLESPQDAKCLFGPGAIRCSAGPLNSGNISGLSAEMADDSMYSNSIAKIDHCSSGAHALRVSLGLNEQGIHQVLARSRPLSVRTMRPPSSGHDVRP